MNMKKEKFIISTVILIIGGALTKILGMLIRIIMTRIVGTEGISLYMLIFPTFSLFMCLSQLGFPVAVSKVVSEEKHNNKKVVFSIIPFSLMLNLVLMLVIIVLAPTLSTKLLKDPRCYYPILSIALVLPFDSLSSILRGYFFGKQRMFPHVLSHVFEQIVRMILIILIVPTLMNKNIVLAVSALVSVNIISEFSSILILFLFIPKNFKISSSDLKPDPRNVKDILKVSLPTTGGRLVGSIGYFLEPILLTLSTTILSINSSYIIKQYGIIEGYVMPLLLLPSFFANAISSALLPVISKLYVNNDIKRIKSKIKQATLISLSIGIPFTLVLIIFPNYFLNIIYHTNEGIKYIRILGPFFLLYYVQSILATTLQSINKSNYIMTDNTIAIIIRSIITLLGCILWGIYGFLLSICVNILVVTFLHYIHVKKAL